MTGDEEPEESFEAIGDVAAQLTDEQLEAELTIAAANPGLLERYEALLAERESHVTIEGGPDRRAASPFWRTPSLLSSPAEARRPRHCRPLLRMSYARSEGVRERGIAAGSRAVRHVRGQMSESTSPLSRGAMSVSGPLPAA